MRFGGISVRGYHFVQATNNNISLILISYEEQGISYAQIGRYETKGTQPPAEVLNKIADVLDTSVDYLINGNNDEKAKATLKDAELLKQFKEVDQLPDQEKNTILKVISAYIRDFKAKQAYA